MQSFVIILSSPSGGGKTTLSRGLLESLDDIEVSISYTTREPRNNEVHGVDYYFVDQEEFLSKIDNEEFLEHKKVFDNFYGTELQAVNGILKQGHNVLLDIDWQGTREVKAKMRYSVVSIYILPPSILELENRLRSRNTDDEDTIRQRMQRSISELSHWSDYDYVLINNDIDECLQDVINIVKVERLKRQNNASELFDNLQKQYHLHYSS